jgi:hypothetical protein
MITDDVVDEILAQRLNAYYAGKNANDIVADLQKKYSAETWTADEFETVFSVRVFKAPIVHVVRRRDGVSGTLAYIDTPRIYFSFVPDNYSSSNSD